MDILNFLSFGLSNFGVDAAIMGIEASVIVYLYKKLMETKEEQIRQAKDQNERSERARETLQRTTDNVLTFIQSHSFKSNRSQ